MEEKIYAWSFDHKYFTSGCDSIDAAVNEAFAESDGEKFCYVGIEKTPTFHIDADNILEIIDEQYLEQSPEWYDGYLTSPITISKDDKLVLERKIKDVIETWMEDTNNYPMFFTVTNADEIIFDEYFKDREF